MFRTKAALLAVVVASSSACYRATIKSGASPSTAPREEGGASFVFGLTSTSTEAPECRQGLSTASVYWPWWGGFVYAITLGIVTPIKMEYTCAGPANAVQ